MSTKISTEHLTRSAYVYIRQSTPDQVHNNLESQRRQYALVDRARNLGWNEVEVIDDDLGCSGSGSVRRPGFERLLASLCDGKVGAVFSIEASRLARNGRDWHTLLEFCSIVKALLIDADGIYDPSHVNDRLLLGMKGTISEMEVTTFRQRAQAAIEQKAQRGELFGTVAIGYVQTADRLEKHPDERVRSAIDLVFRKLAELGSARRVYFWLRDNKILAPVRGTTKQDPVDWEPARYHTLLHMIKNPVYAGAYAYGRNRASLCLKDGRKRVVRKKYANPEEWNVLIKDHHEGYIDWNRYSDNQAMIANNNNAMRPAVRGSVKRGIGLLAGLLHCGHCGEKLVVRYPRPDVVRYRCPGHILDQERQCCVDFSGGAADSMVCKQVLACLRPLSVEAALQAIDRVHNARDERAHQKELALKQAGYDVAHARRQYDEVDPANRLVAAELERRWNAALTKKAQLEDELGQLRQEAHPLQQDVRETLMSLGQDVERLWEHPACPVEHKKRILRTVLKDIIVRAEGDQLYFILHWQGGDHTEQILLKRKIGQHRYGTSMETVDLVRSLARLQPDFMIASILNRMGRRTAHGESWTTKRVCALRHYHDIDVYREGERQARGEMTLREGADILHLPERTMLSLIHRKRLPATQVCKNAPWTLYKSDVDAFLASHHDSPPHENDDQPSLAFQ